MGRLVVSSIALLCAGVCLCACGAARSRSAHGAVPAKHARSARRVPAPSGRRGARALAVAALVRLADVRPQWSEQRTFPPGLRCRSRPFRGARARVFSHRFVQEDASFEETVAVFRDAAGSGRALRRLNSPSSIACLMRTARQRMTEQAEGAATTPELVRREPLGSGGLALRFTSTAQSQIGLVRGVIDAVHVRAGRGVGALLIVSGPRVLTPDVYEGVVALFERRLHAALG